MVIFWPEPAVQRATTVIGYISPTCQNTCFTSSYSFSVPHPDLSRSDTMANIYETNSSSILPPWFKCGKLYTDTIRVNFIDCLHR